MKIFYPLITSLVLIAGNVQLNAQCKATLHISDDGKGGYTFQATVSDTDSIFTSYWLVDSVVIDSNSLNATYKFYANGNHRVCFQYADTTGCSIDTCVTISVQDAEYYPLLDSVNIWSLGYTGCLVAPNPSRSSCDLNYNSTYGDTVINSYNYLSFCFGGFIREDTMARKVYYLDGIGDTEVLLYNFSMKIGDTLTLQTNSNYYPPGTYRLDSIQIITITAGNRRVFFLNLLNPPISSSTNTLVWLESVGSLAHPIYLNVGYGGCGPYCYNYPYNLIFPNGSSVYVACYTHAQNVFFNACAYNYALGNPCYFVQDSCSYGNQCGGAVQNLSILSSFNLSPNPSTGLVTINLEVANSSEFEISVLDLDGRQAIASYPLGKLETGTYSKQIDLSVLPPGFYLVECKTSEGSLYRKLVIAK